MKKERGKNKKKAFQRRIKTYSSILSSPMPHSPGKKSWLFIGGGVLLLTLVAFLSGVRLGKTLQEIKSGQIIAQPTKTARDMGKKESLYKVEEPERSQGVLSPLKEKTQASKTPETSLPVTPEKRKPSAPKAKYTLQIAALHNLEEAQQMVNQLQNKGYPAYQISGSGAAKGTLYRVRIGHFHSLQEAREFALKFEKKEKIKPIITSVSGEQ